MVKMIKKILSQGILLFVLFFVSGLVWAKVAQAATLEFSPTSGTYAADQAFDVIVTVNTDSEDTKGADAVINFDNTVLAVENVTYGDFYPTVLHSEQNSKLYISGMTETGEVKNGEGTLATISFKGLTGGTATLSFECQDGRTDDSNVPKNDLDGTDLIDCTALQTATFTITGGSGTVSDDTDNTGGPSDTGDTTDNTGGIPETGIMDYVRLLPRVLVGLGLIVIGLIPLLL